MLHSYKNQSMDFLWESIDWFLHECNIGLMWLIFSLIFFFGSLKNRFFKLHLNGIPMFPLNDIPTYLHFSLNMYSSTTTNCFILSGTPLKVFLAALKVFLAILKPPFSVKQTAATRLDKINKRKSWWLTKLTPKKLM